MKPLWLLLTLCASLTLARAGLPKAVVPEGVGVNIHFVTGHEKDLDLIAAAGVRYVRMDFSWGGTERQKGQYDWAGYDETFGGWSSYDAWAEGGEEDGLPCRGTVSVGPYTAVVLSQDR